MHPRKYRWSRAYESAEEELTDLLVAKNITAQRLVINDQDELAEQTALTDVTIWCAEGSIAFTVDSQIFRLQAGDTLQIPATLSFSALAGFTGCVYYQASAVVLSSEHTVDR